MFRGAVDYKALADAMHLTRSLGTDRSGRRGDSIVSHMVRTKRYAERAGLYFEELGIDLAESADSTCFRWFLPGLLLSARISETTAKNTYRGFVRHPLTNPRKIPDTGLDFLIFPVMLERGYVRYDGRKSTQVLRDCEMLIADYGGSRTRFHYAARDACELKERLLAFFGVGPVTTNIFLREMRPFWAKAGVGDDGFRFLGHATGCRRHCIGRHT